MSGSTLPSPEVALPPRRPSVRLMFSHPAHLVSFGAGSGLSPVMPGTVGTLWGWLVFAALDDVWGRGPQADLYWALTLCLGWLLGWSPIIRNKVNKTANEKLQAFSEKQR